jgi:Na+/H+ antiporter NhaD/arsenite permease-like protein
MNPIAGSLIVFGVFYVLLVTEKVDKTAGAVLAAAAVIAFHFIPYDAALEAIDLNVLFLLVGMMVMVNTLAETGLFEWTAITIAQKSRGNGFIIMLGLVSASAFLSAWLDNVTTIILIAPITILITQILEIPAAPLLILEAVFSNVGGTATLIGDPPNVLIGSQTKLNFLDFITNLGPLVVVAWLAALLAVGLVYRRTFRVETMARERILRAKPRLAITDPALLRRALPVFGCVVAGFFVGHAYNLEPGIVALAGAMAMAVLCRMDMHAMLSRVEWNTIFFFVGLFMLIGALEHNGLFEWLGEQVVRRTEGDLLLATLVVLWVAAIASALVDNIPLVIAMIPLIKSIVPTFAAGMGLEAGTAAAHLEVAQPLFWALALGACFGGNGALIGASANVVITQTARRNGYNITFMDFTKVGLPLMLITLALSTVYVWFRYFVLN